MSKKVLIVGSMGNCAYGTMYKDEGYEIVNTLDEADLVQFTGGADVSPDLYNCAKHPATQNSPHRDEVETALYQRAKLSGIPCVGICRGGQFLNVMNGGRMYQHVDGHAVGGTHEIRDMRLGYLCQATSTHHQMMIKGDNGLMVASASPHLATRKEYMDDEGALFIVEPEEYEIDTESVYYHHSRSLCFQPHPEFQQGVGCRGYFFALVEGHLFKEWERMEELAGDRIHDSGDGYIEFEENYED